MVTRLSKELLAKLDTEKLHSDIVLKVEALEKQLTVILTETDVRSHTVPQRRKEIKMLRLYDPELEDK